MIKYLACSIFVISVVVLFVRETVVLPSGQIPNFLEMLAEEQRIKDKVAAQRIFHEELEATLDYLVRGEMQLKEATEIIHETAQTHAPTYLCMVPISDPGNTLRESIARNLLGHLRMRSAVDANMCEQVSTLETQLHEMADASL